jgi:hypothetical protein
MAKVKYRTIKIKFSISQGRVPQLLIGQARMKSFFMKMAIKITILYKLISKSSIANIFFQPRLTWVRTGVSKPYSLLYFALYYFIEL